VLKLLEFLIRDSFFTQQCSPSFGGCLAETLWRPNLLSRKRSSDRPRKKPFPPSFRLFPYTSDTLSKKDECLLLNLYSHQKIEVLVAGRRFERRTSRFPRVPFRRFETVYFGRLFYVVTASVEIYFQRCRRRHITAPMGLAG